MNRETRQEVFDVVRIAVAIGLTQDITLRLLAHSGHRRGTRERFFYVSSYLPSA